MGLCPLGIPISFIALGLQTKVMRHEGRTVLSASSVYAHAKRRVRRSNEEVFDLRIMPGWRPVLNWIKESVIRISGGLGISNWVLLILEYANPGYERARPCGYSGKDTVEFPEDVGPLV